MRLVDYFRKHNFNCDEKDGRVVFPCGVSAYYEREFDGRNIHIEDSTGIYSGTLKESLILVPEIIRDELLAEYRVQCAEIAKSCEEEGYPSHGENYELRCDDLWDDYAAMFPEYLEV